MSDIDAVDGSSTGTSVPWMWVLLKLPRFGGAKHASDHDTRSRHCEAGLSGSWHGCGWQCHHPPSAQAALRAGILSEAATLPDRHRSLRLVASLVTRAPGAWSHRTADAAGLCEALCEAAQERCH